MTAALLAELIALREALRWIPCSERMPEEGLTVLVNVNGQGFAASYIKPTWSALEPSTGFVEYPDTEDITHWMPIPPMKDIK